MADEHAQTAARVISRIIARPWREQRDVIAAALAAAEQRGRDETARKVRELADTREAEARALEVLARDYHAAGDDQAAYSYEARVEHLRDDVYQLRALADRSEATT